MALPSPPSRPVVARVYLPNINFKLNQHCECLHISLLTFSTEGSAGWKQRCYLYSSWPCLHTPPHTHLNTPLALPSAPLLFLNIPSTLSFIKIAWTISHSTWKHVSQHVKITSIILPRTSLITWTIPASLTYCKKIFSSLIYFNSPHLM